MASAAQTAAASKKNKKKGKKFVALPSLESCEAQLPWKLAFTQRLGRHAVAKTNLPAGSLVLREAAVGSVVLEQCAAFVCHSCLQELPDSDQPAHTAVVDCKASQFHRFCDRACQREFMASRPAWVARVYATVPELAKASDCTPGMLQILLELQRLRIAGSGPAAQPADVAAMPAAAAVAPASDAGDGQQPNAGSPDSHSPISDPEHKCSEAHSDGGQHPASGQQHSDAKQQPNGAAEGAAAQHTSSGASPPPAVQSGQVPVVRCTLADVVALQSHWHQSSEARRKALTAGCTALHKAIADAIAEEEGSTGGTALPGGTAPQGAAQRAGSVQQLQELAGIADSNIHSLGTGSRNQEIAVGLFPALSMLNHSCSPNCCFQATGKEMAVRTTRDVKAGEQLCVSYINLFEMRPVRQRQLLATKFFRCQCERCAQPLPQSTDRFLEGVQCSARGCRGLLLAQDPGGEDHTPWKCDTCAVEVPAVNAEGTGPQNIVNKATIIWQRNMAVMQHQGHAMAKAMFEDLLKEFDRPGKLQRLHMVLFDSLVPLMNCCRAAGDTAGAISYLSKVTAAMEELHVTPNSPELANYLTLHGMLLADRANGAPAAFKARLKKQAKETLARAAAMRKICLGPEHPATLDALDKIRQV